MNKHILGLVLAGLICIGGQTAISYGQEKNEVTTIENQQIKSKNGWVVENDGYDWCYYKNGVMLKSQWMKEGQKWYYFSESGEMVSHRTCLIDGKYYLFNENGVMVEKSGWTKINHKYEDGEYWYNLNGNGTVKTEQWMKEQGKWYYLYEDGHAASRGTVLIDEKYYVFDESCIMVEKKGWIGVVPDYEPGDWAEGEFWYYGNGDGTVKTEQWIKDNGKWYYVGNSGKTYTSGSSWIDDKYYVFDKNGVLVEKKGWIKIDFKYYPVHFWYYGNGDGTVKTNQWIKDSGKWYYVSDAGNMAISESRNIDGKDYIFDDKGVCLNP